MSKRLERVRRTGAALALGTAVLVGAGGVAHADGTYPVPPPPDAPPAAPELPRTGGDALELAGIGAAMLAAGGGLVLIGRRRAANAARVAVD
jgi:LPXTG-motif cell wall-anchored protein